MGVLFKLEEIQFETNLSKEQVIEIAQEYVKKQDILYEINTERILYDAEFYYNKEPMWYIRVIAVLNKGLWSDGYETLILSDRESVAKYVMNDHGRLFEV